MHEPVLKKGTPKQDFRQNIYCMNSHKILMPINITTWYKTPK